MAKSFEAFIELGLRIVYDFDRGDGRRMVGGDLHSRCRGDSCCCAPRCEKYSCARPTEVTPAVGALVVLRDLRRNVAVGKVLVVHP
jgi:hypothetical protein